ncbi:Bug family tripartite tricarboxylate transporter substrate binding protein [Bosea caraganae]|uniref:Bug family tripartite tricarboxylate transporter substrate binding protein n=1 Tax=Bosea caraganae TaxID=2763117 RepID=UPI0011C03A7B|nr:tripartite tricarboxylate transporter substrate binding protein [Bosea caraganae]
MNRRQVTVLLAALAAGMSSGAWAEQYPVRTVKLVVPNPPGGGTDLVARIVAERLSALWGHTAIVENKPGGGGNIGAQSVARAKPDGYTLFAGYGGVMTVNQYLYKNLGFDPAKDLRPITLSASAAYVVAVHPGVPAKSLSELVALVKASPGKFSWASTAVGTQDHIGGELLQYVTGMKMTHVPYKGGAEGLLDVVAGRIPVNYVTIPTSIAQVQQGGLRALAVTGAERSALLPEVPTVAEAGAPGAENLTWFGLWAPAGTPDAIVKQISEDVRKVLAPADAREQLSKGGFSPQPMTPDEFGAFVLKEREKYGRIVGSLGLEKQ